MTGKILQRNFLVAVLLNVFTAASNDGRIVGCFECCNFLTMALNDEQIVELAKLPFGVAAVYQNDWIEAVLCLFEGYTQKSPYSYTPSDTSAA